MSNSDPIFKGIYALKNPPRRQSIRMYAIKLALILTPIAYTHMAVADSDLSPQRSAAIDIPWLASNLATDQDQSKNKDRLKQIKIDLEKTEHALLVTQDLIRKNPDAYRLPDLYLRLAELLVEKSRLAYGRILASQPKGTLALGNKQALEVKIAKKLAIETYGRILRDFKKFKKSDQVLFYRAHEWRELGDNDKMQADHQELIKRFPKSPWTQEAYLIQGDMALGKGDLVAAQSAYSKVFAGQEGSRHDLARYKMGWLKIQDRKFKEAYTLFESVILSQREATKRPKSAYNKKKKSPSNPLQLERDALVAITWPFSETRKPHEAHAVFSNLASSRSLYLVAMRRLANRYFIKTQYNHAASIYRKTIAHSGQSDENLVHLGRIYDAWRRRGKRSRKKWLHLPEDVASIAKHTLYAASDWHLKPSKHDAIVDDFEVRARDMATQLHGFAQDKNQGSWNMAAAQTYQNYLQAFASDAASSDAAPKEPQKPSEDVRINLAEALFTTKQYIQAGKIYEDLGNHQQNTEEKKKLLRSALIAYVRADQDDTEARDALQGSQPANQAAYDKLLSPWDRVQARSGLYGLGKKFMKLWPNDAKTPEIRFNIARSVFEQGKYNEAVSLFVAYMERYPNSQESLVALDLAIESLDKLGRYDAMSALAARLQKKPNIQKSPLALRLKNIQARAQDREVELAIVKSKDEDFGPKMIRAWQKNKGTQLGEDYLHSAFVKFSDDGNAKAVFDFGGKFIDAYPKSKRLPSVLLTMGNMAVQTADFQRAAQLFDVFAARFPNHTQSAANRKRSIGLRIALGESDAAMKLLDTQIAQSSSTQNSSAQSSSAQQQWAMGEKMRLAHTSSDWRALKQSATQASKAYPDWSLAWLALSQSYAAQGDWQKSQSIWRRVAQAPAPSQATELESDIRAWQAWSQMSLLTKSFFDIQFSQSPANNEAILQQKLDMLASLEATSVQSIAYAHPMWSLASMAQLSEAYLHLADFIARAPKPQGSAGDAVAKILKQESDAYAQKAQQTYAACAQKAAEFNALNPGAKRCLTHSQVSSNRGQGMLLGSMFWPNPQSSRRLSTGEISHKSLSQKEKADITEIRDQLAQSNDLPKWLLALGRATGRVGHWHESYLALTRLVEVAPQNGVGHNLAGVAAWHLGRYSQAHTHLQKSLDLGDAAAERNIAALYRLFGHDSRAQTLESRLGPIAKDRKKDIDLHPQTQRNNHKEM